MWAIAKRIFLFAIVNILVITTLTIVWSFVSSFFGIQGDGMGFLIIYCVLFGVGGAFISLMMSKFMAKMMMGVKIVEPNTGGEYGWLVQTVHNLSRQAGLRTMPEVGVYESPETNAFATGPSRNNSLVAVSTGLINRMNKDEIEGVLGHEVAHIANGDMVTMTLIQGVINAVVMILARLIASVAASNVEERSRGTVHFLLVIVLQIVFSLLGVIVVNYFSRAREFRADKGGARLAGKEKMIGALRVLGRTKEAIDDEHRALATLKISGHTGSIIALLFATHPPIEDRIRALEAGY